MVVVPADAVVLVSCLSEQLEDLTDPASLADPVALNDHQVADSCSGRIPCPAPIAARPSLIPVERAYSPLCAPASTLPPHLNPTGAGMRSLLPPTPISPRGERRALIAAPRLRGGRRCPRM